MNWIRKTQSVNTGNYEETTTQKYINQLTDFSSHKRWYCHIMTNQRIINPTTDGLFRGCIGPPLYNAYFSSKELATRYI